MPFLILLLLFALPLDAARVIGVYDPNKEPPGGHRDPYAVRPVESYGQPMGARKKGEIGTQPLRLYDQSGLYRGRWTDDPFHPESIANPQGRYSKVYITRHEVLYVLDGELIAEPFYPSYVPRKERTIEIESGPVWSGPFWNHWRWNHPWD